MNASSHLTLVPLVTLACALFLGACGDNQSKPKERAGYVAGEPAKLTCVPNLDGKIEASELAPTFNVPVRFLVSPAGKDQPIDLAPKTDSAGKLRWTYSVDSADDQAAEISAGPIQGKWYEGKFPGASFVSAFDAAGRTESIYAYDPSGIALMGLASREPDPPEGRTLLVYSTPVPIYKFPLTQGLSYTSVGEIRNATLRGLPYAGRDTYEIKVDAVGQLELPDVIFTQTLRVRTKVTLEPVAGQATTQLQTSFLFECFGEVMRATSKPGEKSEDFTVASEIRRFGLP